MEFALALDLCFFFLATFSFLFRRFAFRLKLRLPVFVSLLFLGFFVSDAAGALCSSSVPYSYH